MQVTVDQDSRAHAGGGVDVRYDARWQRRIAREVMIEVLDGRAVAREAIERRTVRVRRHVAHRDAVAGTRVDAVEKRDVPLRSGDEDGIARVRETELDDGADAVRVAVEDDPQMHGVD